MTIINYFPLYARWLEVLHRQCAECDIQQCAIIISPKIALPFDMLTECSPIKTPPGAHRNMRGADLSHRHG